MRFLPVVCKWNVNYNAGWYKQNGITWRRAYLLVCHRLAILRLTDVKVTLYSFSSIVLWISHILGTDH